MFILRQSSSDITCIFLPCFLNWRFRLSLRYSNELINVVLSFDSVNVTTEMKVTEKYFPVVLFIMLYKVVLTFESVDEILKCDHSNESY